MKILLVDDNPRRYERLVERLVAAEVKRADIHIVTCAMDARNRLQAEKYDLMVLDIVLPLRSDEAPDDRHSQELLVELLDYDEMIRPRQIVGLSAYEIAAGKVAPFFAENLWTVITYSESNDGWITQILNCVNYLRNQDNTPKQRTYMTDVAIVCALQDPELNAVLDLKWNWQDARPIDDVTFVHDGSIEIGGQKISIVAAAASRMGMVSAALLSAKLIEAIRPKFLVMLGICAGVKGKIKIGDVLLADPSWDWQSGKRVRDKENASFSVSPHQISVSASIRSCFEQLRNDRGAISSIADAWKADVPHQLKLVVGPMASGSAVLADGDVVSAIKQQHRDLCGIEMEAYGVYSAAAVASYPRPAAFALKSVCDYADPDKNDDHQKYAAYASAKTFELFLTRFYPQIRDSI